MKKNKKKPFSKERFQREIPYHLMLLPGIIIVLIYSYFPMFGLIMAFQNYKPSKGIMGSAWIGFTNFKRFFSYPDTWNIIGNTLYIAIFKLILGIIVPVIFALLLNEIKNKFFSGFVQTITCLPHFLSWVILGGIFVNILSPSNGIINKVIELFGGEALYFLGDNELFPWTMVLTDVWKGFGYSSIIYIASISGIDLTLYEAARADGANKLQQIIHVTLPGILPMIFVMAILSLGNVLNAGFDQIFNLYSPQVYESGDILDTFIYRLGMVDAQYGLSAAVGMLKSAISLGMMVIGYKLAERYGDYRVF